MQKLTPEEAVKKLEQLGCIWYNPNPSKYCALLVSGKVSNGFINFRRIYETGAGLELLKNMIWSMFISDTSMKFSGHNVGLVSGTAYGSLIPAYEMARLFGCGYSWTDKIEDPETGKSKGQVCKTDVAGKRVLFIEDVLTTGGSVMQSRQAVSDAGGIVLDPLLTLVNRSGKDHADGTPISSFIDLVFEVHEPDASPWKTAVPIKPKLEGNWEKLVTQV
jgi:orotate phosphoribosyltransferase